MDFEKTGKLKVRYFADNCEFKKTGEVSYILKSTTNPKYTPFINHKKTESAWDMISRCDYTHGEEHEKAYNLLLNDIKAGKIKINRGTNFDLKEDEEILFSLDNIRIGEANTNGYGRTEMIHRDTGRVTITNKRFLFKGPNKKINISLKQITGVSCFTNGIALSRKNKKKIENFLDFEKLAFSHKYAGKDFYFECNGIIIKAFIEGGLKLLNESKPKRKTNRKTSSKKEKDVVYGEDEILFKYAELYEKGVLSAEEFELKKNEIFAKKKERQKLEELRNDPNNTRVICPFCNNEIIVPPHLKNKKFSCPHCKKDGIFIKANMPHVDCPYCGMGLTYTEDLLGKRVQCEHCKASFKLTKEGKVKKGLF